MSIFDDPFDRDGDGHLNFAEEAERDYWFFDRDEENNSRDNDNDYSRDDDNDYSGCSCDRSSYYTPPVNKNRTASADPEPEADPEEAALIREEFERRKKKKRTIAGIVFLGIVLIIVLIAAGIKIKSYINGSTYIKSISGYYVADSYSIDTKEEYIARTIHIVSRSEISIGGETQRVTGVDIKHDKIYLESCTLYIYQKNGDDGIYYYIIGPGTVLRNSGMSTYNYKSEKEYNSKLESLPSES